MPRPERPLDPLAGPVHAFAAELRKLRDQAGNPKYLQMARRTGKSRTALSEAAGGDHLPTWETVEAYVTACGADTAPWRLRWEQVEEQVHQRRLPEPRRVPEHLPAPKHLPAPERLPAPEPAVTWVDAHERTAVSDRRLMALIGVLVVLVVLSASAAGVLLLARTDGGNGPAADAPAGIVLRSGPRTVEIRSADSGPVFLSGLPQAGCAERGCALAGYALEPGEFWVVSCYTGGDMMTDAVSDRLRDSRIQNPKDFRSNGWYGSLMYDGRMAYLSEVNVLPEYRGGLTLPECQGTPESSMKVR